MMGESYLEVWTRDFAYGKNQLFNVKTLLVIMEAFQKSKLMIEMSQYLPAMILR